MIQTSAEFESVIGRETRTFLARMVFGTFTLSEEIRQITIHMGNADGEAFIDGAAYSSHVDISMNISNADITGQEFRLEIGLLLDDNTVEYVPVGIYKAAAADITKTKYTMTVTAWDRMGRKANAAYVPAVLYPCTAGAVLDDITNQTGLVFDTSEFPGIRNIDGLSFPEEYLVSNVIGFIAGLRGGFAYVDYTGTVILAKYPTVSALMVPAARCLDEIALQDDIYTVDAGGEVTAYSYYPGTVRFLGDPRLEPKDMITVVDTLDVSRNVPCMGITATYDGGLTTVVSAPAQAASDRVWGPIQSRVNAALLKAEEAHNEAEAAKTTASNAQTAAASAQNTATNAQTAAANAQTAAANALTTANGKNKIFYQDSAPGSGMSVGDIWFDTDGGNAIYEYTANGWVLRQFGNGSIAANSITAVEINVASLSAISANIGTVTAGVLRSADYSYSSGTYTAAGMIVDLNNKVIRTPKTAILSDGSIYSSSVDLEGKITATSGRVGGWEIGSGLYTGQKTAYGDDNDGLYLGSDGIDVETSNGYVRIAPRQGIRLKRKNEHERFFIRLEGTDGGAYTQTTVELSYITIRGKTYNNNAYSSGNPQLRFENTDATKGCALTFTDSATIQSPASITLAGNQGGEYFIAPNIKATGAFYGTLTGHASLDLPLTGGTLSGNLTFSATTDNGIIQGYNGTTKYNILRNHGNGNVSLSACSAGLYLGYTNTTFINFMNGLMSLNSQGHLTMSRVIANVTSGEAEVVASNGTHRLYMYCHSDGRSGLYGFNADGTGYGIITIVNGATTGTFYGHSSQDLALSGGTMTGNITLGNNNWVFGKDTGGTARALVGYGADGYMYFGYGSKTGSVGASVFDGNTVYIRANGNVHVEAAGMLVKNEACIYAQVPRKKAGGGGWAYSAYRFLDNASSTFAQIGVYGSDNTLSYMYIGVGGYDSAYNLRIDPSGNVTIGGTVTGKDYSGTAHVMVGSAADSSHRVGYLYHQNPTTVRVYGQAGGSVYTTYTTLTGSSSSDIRLKRNVENTEVESALNVINQIEMKSFDWLPGWRDYTHQPIGMIADQIEKLDNRLVIGGGYDPNGEPNYKVIDDHYLACYLTKGVQELCDRIEMLEHEIKKLKGAA